MIGQHPWRELFIGALVDGTVRKYNPDTGICEHPYGKGEILSEAD